jgi:hypothetical protein
MHGAISPLPPICLSDVVLSLKHGDNFTFTFTLNGTSVTSISEICVATVLVLLLVET